MPYYEKGYIRELEPKIGVHEKSEPFPYQTRTASVRELAEHNDIDNETLKRLDELGLEDFYFEVHSRKAKTYEKQSPEEQKDRPNVYVLLHGWTGSHKIFTDVKNENGLTVVEEILAKDPDAIIITPDGNGFGDTRFKEDLPNLGERIDKSTPNAYADQIEFLLRDVFKYSDEDLKKVRIAGHSMGGACAYEMARRGYEAVAIAPAALPMIEDMREVVDNFPGSISLDNRDNLRNSVRAVYTGLGLSNYIAELAKEKANIPSDRIVEFVFKSVMAKYLMGENTPGDIPIEVNKQIIRQLIDIHNEELAADKTITVASTMYALAQGVAVSTWNEDEIKMCGNKLQAVFLGEKDNLVKSKDAPDFQKVLAAQLLVSPEIQTQREGADLSRELTKITRVFPNAGHYSALYEPEVIDAIIAPSKREVKYGNASLYE